jgi:hypothetical protein
MKPILMAVLLLLTSCTSGVHWDTDGCIEGYTESRTVDEMKK